MCTRVFIGRLSHRASERDVEDFFRGYGRIKDIVLKNGFGFVEFESSRDADDAIYDLNGKELGGERVTLEFSKRSRDNDRYDDRRGGYSGGGGGGRGYGRPRPGDRYGPPIQTRHRLIVDNLSTRISWQDLKDIMRKNGCEVTYADAHKTREHEAVVCFATRSDLDRAIDKLQGEELNGRKIKLLDDSKERSRSRSKGHRSHSRSRSPRSRSKSRGSRSKSHSKSRSKSHSKSQSRSRSASRGKENGNGRDSHSRSASPKNGNDDRSASNSPRKGGSDRSASNSP